MKIQDGAGSGYEAAVDNENRLATTSVIETRDKHVNRHSGKAWSFPFTTTPTGAGDYFFYFKNTGTEDYFLTDIRLDAASAEVVGVDSVSGTASFAGGAAITPVNRNLSSEVVPSATVQYDTDTTGLTKVGEIFFLTCEANVMCHLRTTSNVVITPGKAIALRAVTGAIAIQGTISISGAD